MHSLIRNVGNGASRHDLVGDLLIILPISSSVTRVKTVNLGGSKGDVPCYRTQMRRNSHEFS